MIKISLALLAFVIPLVLPSAAFPQSTTRTGQQTSATTGDQPVVITSGKIQITAPAGWKTAVDLNDKADLQAADVKNQMYLIVLTDNKIDYSDMTLDKHSRSTLEALLKPLTSMTMSGPTNLRINGDPTVQYEVRGTIEGINVVYLHTTVETSAHFQQIVTWTTVSGYLTNKDVIQAIIRSFKEIGR
jgi:hypothetical protein